MLNKIPVLELGEAGFASRVIEAFHDIGFVLVKAPAVQPRYDVFKTVFDLPRAVKESYRRADIHHQRGYVPEHVETGIYCRPLGMDGSKGVSDSKEMWSIGPEGKPDPALAQRYPESYYPNIWPAEAPEFKPAALGLYRALYPYGVATLNALAGYLGAGADHFDLARGQHHYRILKYSPVLPADVGHIIWACGHTDINLVTVLPASSRPGLFIRRRDGEWIGANTPEAHGCVFVQVGDMLQRFTAGRFMSAVHEVRAPHEPTGEGRISAALFIHPAASVLLDASQHFQLTASEREKYPPIRTYDFLIQRLQEIGQ